MRNELTFFDMKNILQHGIDKHFRAEIYDELASQLEPFISFCLLDGRTETAEMISSLHKSLTCYSVDATNTALGKFYSHIVDNDLKNIAPTFRHREIWMYKRNDHKAGLLFCGQNLPILRAVESILTYHFSFERVIDQLFVKDMAGDVTIICDTKSASMLHAENRFIKHCVIDFIPPDSSNNGIFIKLPLAGDGYEALCSMLNIL